MPQLNITIDDIVKEIGLLSKETPDGFTTRELSYKTGYSQNWCQEKIRKLIKSGQVVFNGKKRIVGIDERTSYSPVYKVVKGG